MCIELIAEITGKKKIIVIYPNSDNFDNWYQELACLHVKMHVHFFYASRRKINVNMLFPVKDWF